MTLLLHFHRFVIEVKTYLGDVIPPYTVAHVNHGQQKWSCISFSCFILIFWLIFKENPLSRYAKLWRMGKQMKELAGHIHLIDMRCTARVCKRRTPAQSEC